MRIRWLILYCSRQRRLLSGQIILLGFYAVLLETTQEETTLKENEEKYKKIIFVLKNIRSPIRSGLIIKEEIK